MSEDELRLKEVERRREEALKRMLSTPHQPHRPKPDSKTIKASSPKRKPTPKS